MTSTLATAAISALLLFGQAGASWAQRVVPNPASMTADANAGTIGVISGGIQGTYIRIAADLATALDDGQLRVLPIIGRGSVQNVADLLYVRGVDVAIVQADVLSYMERDRSYPGLQKSVQYITKLYDEELHILARADIRSVQDLADKPVNVDGVGSGTAMTASVVFNTVGVKPQIVNDTQAVALQKLQRGEIAALVYVTGKPASLFGTLATNEAGLHFLPVPLTPALLDIYLPARLEHAQYAALVPEDEVVDTVAVGAVMAVYAWPRSTARYDKVARFVTALFTNIGKLRLAPNHPKWADVNLAAQLPGWSRFAAAQDALSRSATLTQAPRR
ncbi:MAG: TAXI family TRAP transporter solute-binding subunit [Janthinobacterium lividum]